MESDEAMVLIEALAHLPPTRFWGNPDQEACGICKGSYRRLSDDETTDAYYEYEPFITHAPDCLVTKARALLAADGEPSPAA